MGARPRSVLVPLALAVFAVAALAPRSPAESDPAADDNQWVMPAKNYASTRFSGLGDINTTNAKELRVAWTFSTGVNRGQETAPLVVGKTMYLVTPTPTSSTRWT